MGFDGDDDWALSDDGWNLILAGGDHVVDDFADDLEALRSGRRGFKDTSMFRALPPLHLGRYDEAFAEAFLAATRAVAAKLRRAYEEGWPYPSEGLLGSVADETRHGGDPGGSGGPGRATYGGPESLLPGSA